MFLICKKKRYDLTGSYDIIGYKINLGEAQDYCEFHSNNKEEYFYLKIQEVRK